MMAVTHAGSIAIQTPELHLAACGVRRFRCLDDAEFSQLVGRPPRPDESILVQCDCGAYVQ